MPRSPGRTRAPAGSSRSRRRSPGRTRAPAGSGLRIVRRCPLAPPSVRRTRTPAGSGLRIVRLRPAPAVDVQKIATGATVDPVAPSIFSGWTTNANSYTPAAASSSSRIRSTRWMPLTTSIIW